MQSRFIKRLQEKPEAERKKILITTSVSITGVIFLVWLSVLGVSFLSSNDVTLAKESQKTTPNFVMLGQVKTAWKDVVKGFGVIKNETGRLFQGVKYYSQEDAQER